MLLGGVLLLTACLKDDFDGAIRLSVESFTSDGAKVSVEDNTVVWEDGDAIGLNNQGVFHVHVSDGNAYIDNPGFSTVSALYPCPSGNGFFISSRPTITVPATYSSSDNYMVGTRQHIPLPMGSYYSGSENPTSLTFRHVSAAVKVLLWNACPQDIIVDKVVVTTDTYRINGSVSLDLTRDDLGVAASYASSSASDRSVSVQFPSSGEGALVIASGDNTKSVQVPILPIGEDNITIEVYAHAYTASSSTSMKVYSYTASSPALARNRMLTAKVKINTDFPSRRVTLSNGTSYTAQDGDMLTGSTNSEIKIANGATVFLNNVTITVPDDDGHRFSALACEGNATIILMGTNNLTGGRYASGLQAGNPGTTLTIKGSGSLTTRGRDHGAGIGSVNTAISGYVKDCGNIVIEGGTITAYGGSYAAAIGGAETKDCGDITITGGNVKAYGGNWAAGIGSSDGGTSRASWCGNITISGGTVYAKGGVLAAGIGCGVYGCCENITITNDVTRVEAVKGDDYSGNSAPCSIGQSLGGNGFPNSYCYGVTIGGTNTWGITDSPFVYEP